MFFVAGLCVATSFTFAGESLPPPGIGFEHLTIKDGLANPIIYDIKQDKSGYIWLATGNGVSKYDGYEITNYLPNEAREDSIGAGSVIQLFIDDKSRLWAVVIGGGLYLYDENRDNFSSLQHDPDNPNSLSSNSVYSMTQDKAGNLWVSTVDSGLNKYNESSGTFTHYRSSTDDSNGLVTDKIVSIFIDSKDDLWISTLDKGLSRLDLSTNTVTRLLPDLLPGGGIIEDRFGDMWISTLGEGLVRYIRSEKRFISYKNDVNDSHSLSHNQVVRMVEDGEGTLWITTWGGGISVFDRENNRFLTYETTQPRHDSLSSNNTWAVFADRSNVLWVGTYGSGVNIYDRKKEQFQKLQYRSTGSDLLPEQNIKALLESSSGFIWAGSLGGGISRYNPDNQSYTHYRHNPHDEKSISSDYIWGIDEDSAGNLWIATEKGLNKFNPETGVFTRYLHKEETSNSLGNNIVRSVIVDKNDTIWLGTQNRGIDRFESQKNQFTHYEVIGAHHSILYEDKTGRIWSGNAQTLNYFDEKSEKFINAANLFENEKEFVGSFFTAIKEDNKGRLWFGTTRGLYLLDADGRVSHYGKKNGLVDEAIADFQFDSYDRLWISNSNGLSFLDVANGKSFNFEMNSFNRGASLKTKNEDLFFGGQQGVTFFNPNTISPNKNVPPIVITQFETLNQEYVPHALVDDVGPPVRLTPKDRFFSIGFAALDYSNPTANRFLYMLEGFDATWREASSKNRFATYTNLDAGEYLFKVVGSNNEGVWNMTGTSLRLVVLAPWWKSWWFYALVGRSRFAAETRSNNSVLQPTHCNTPFYLC